ncbi:MAG: DUF1580 domain-containing protein [Pseudomonadales bacterium]
MTSLLQEHRISLTELAQREGVAVPTVWRWRQKGCRGVRLETFVIGAKRFTTEEAFARFVERTTAVADGEVTVPAIQSSRQREAAANRTIDELAARHQV